MLIATYINDVAKNLSKIKNIYCHTMRNIIFDQSPYGFTEIQRIDII